MAKRDLYTVLGLGRSATEDEIKKAYRKMAMKYHPDKNPGDKAAEDRFKEVTEAYETLRDPQRRKLYDQFGQTASTSGQNPFGSAGAYGNPFDPFGSMGRASDFSRHENPEHFQDVFSDFFGDIFSSGGAGRSSRTGFRFHKGSDLRYSLQISLEEAATGKVKVISFMRNRGGREDTAKLSITVPAGVKEGQRLKLKGEGDFPEGASGPGDLFVIVHFQEHPLLNRQGNDVLLDVPISFVDAILGATVEIPTLTGRASLLIPPGTHPGQIFRLKGKGFPEVGGSTSGDMLARIIIDIPKGLSEDERRQIQKLGDLSDRAPLVVEFKEKMRQLMRTRS